MGIWDQGTWYNICERFLQGGNKVVLMLQEELQ
jgi:hypothetical protein